MASSTKERLLEAGMPMLLARGYNALGIQELLDATRVPKGSFYHHFESKDDFVLQVVDRYMAEVHAALEQCLHDESTPALDRVRRFFDTVQDRYRHEGYLGCLLGELGQELAGTSEVFRAKIEGCIAEIARQIASCLKLAVRRGELSGAIPPAQLANLLVNCWEGAALRSRLRRDPAPLRAMLDFYFRSAAAL